MATRNGKAGAAERPIMSTGIGESKLFNAADGADLEDLNNPRHPANCTLRGEPIPQAMWPLISYGMTDQGWAEAHDGKDTAHASVVVDEVHQKIRHRGGDLEMGMEPFDAYDPMQELVREYVPAGMRPKFLSQRKVQAEGTTRGYTIAKDANGDPVKLGTSVLGYMPEERARLIQQAFEDRSLSLQREIHGEDFDPRRPTGERVVKRVAKQEGDLSSSLTGGSYASFENPGPEGSEFGLQGTGGEDFTL